MKRFILIFALLIIVAVIPTACSTNQIQSRLPSQNVTTPTPTPNVFLQPTHIAYADAITFTQSLSDHGFTVKSVGPSLLESFLRGTKKAAYIEIDKGVVQVIFFPEPDGAEKVRVIEGHKDGGYLYSFQGQPEPEEGDGFVARDPMYFIMHRNLLMVTGDKELSTELKRVYGHT